MSPFNTVVYVKPIIVYKWIMVLSLQLKMVILVHGWLCARAAPLAMLQHATSSQSIVFHQPQPAIAPPTPTASAASTIDQFGRSQPKYEYKYEVSDHQTGDRKSHWESRDGDTVRGVYTLYEPDGALRTVEYSADAIHGFNAVVRRDEPSKLQHPRLPDPRSRVTSTSGDYNGGHEYIPERSSHSTNQRYLGAITHNSDVGFSVSHVAGLQRSDENLNQF